MKKSTKIGKGKGARTVGQIEFTLANLKDALFTVLVPAYGRLQHEDIDDENPELNLEVVRAVGRCLSSGKYFSCPECEKVLLVGAKSGYPFLHFHELLKELKRYGA